MIGLVGNVARSLIITERLSDDMSASKLNLDGGPMKAILI